MAQLHLGLDLVSGEIVCSELTADDVGDPTALPDLLDQIDGCNQRSRGETLMGRWKTVIEQKHKARAFNNQKTEAMIGVCGLNRMTELGRAEFVRIS